ncbi:hypothetical protein PGSY75_1122100 [Plasmodium gaboni]|uniref:GPI transamidase component GPI16 n=1 Tax=Plasmodium gaboni TaxID=647221 RepID=A0A151LIU3_9APIC|nr:hypothetical protein PGSY75_1122100 [Plasmodium gaboni]KYN98862.1 hypothetical protein PGSY75_1122100 [Plasmodium gaboni]
MKSIIYIYLSIIYILSFVNSYLIDESINLLPLENDLVHVKLKLTVNGKDYKEFLPINILKILNNVNSLKINIKRGVYREYYNNKYLDSYPYGFTFVVDLKKEERDKNDFSKEKEYNEFSKNEMFLLKSLLNDIWGITGVSTNLLKTKDLIKVDNKIFAFLPDESICMESFSLIKKMYPCKNFGGLFNLINPSYLITTLSTNIGFELNDNDENFFVLYIEYITEHNHKENITINDLINTKYNINECPLINRTALIVKKKEEDYVSTIFEKYDNIAMVYEDINIYDILQRGKPNIIEEYINVNVYKEESNSMITTDIRKKQSSLVYVFENLNDKNSSNFLFVDKLPYYLSPLLHTLVIQGKNSNKNDNSKKYCDFIYFGFNAINKFDIKFSNIDMMHSLPKNGNYYYINFKYILPPKCDIIIRFEIIKIQIRSFEFDFDIDRGILLESGIFKQKKNYISNEKNDDYIYKYTSSLLIDIVLPDTSMPFNVIAISTCVIMLFFGFIFKLTAKEQTRYV